ncbi:MAG: gliding motility-associated C-terminal domain-containing protein, partial [Flavobacteriales bacterium]
MNVDDGDACTIDSCVNGLAVHTPVNVDDGDACTIDSCVNGVAVHTPIPALDASWNSPGTLCASVGPVGLNGYVTGDPTGTWSGNGISGSVFSAQGVPGVYPITYTVGSGACQSQQTHVITIVADPDAQAGADAAICGLSYEMQASSNSMITGAWTLTSGLVANSLNDPNATVVANAYGTYTLVWTVTNGVCTASDTVVVTFHDPGIGIAVDAGPDQYLDVVTSTFLNGQTTPGASLQWSLSSGSGSISSPNDSTTEVIGLGIGDNVFVLSANIGQCASTLDTVLVHVDDLFIPEGYSPNGDGVNDAWEITGMEAFPGSELRIFNRWGQEVYQVDSYANQWDGRANNSRPLPDDTYFYVLNLSGDRTYNGHVIIKR